MKTIHVTLSFAIQVPDAVASEDITFSLSENHLLARYPGSQGEGEPGSARTSTYEASITAEVHSVCMNCQKELTEQEQGWGNNCQECQQQAAEAQRREKNWQRGQRRQQQVPQ